MTAKILITVCETKIQYINQIKIKLKKKGGKFFHVLRVSHF